MKYVYFPGCSLKSSGKAYEESVLAVFAKLGVQLPELPDWNCCGATYYFGVDEVKGLALAARNLCLAEQAEGEERTQLVTPCSACYLAHTKAQHYMQTYGKVGQTIQEGLGAAGLHYGGRVEVRHPLDVLVNDIGLDRIKEKATKPLKGLKVACYYGCQVVRPYATFDDRRDPVTMDQILRTAGADTVDWSLKVRCCGASLTGTVPEAGQSLAEVLLHEARKKGANVIATACSLCQFNLECYQDQIKRRYGRPADITVAYFTQLLGRALDIPDRQLGFQRLFVPMAPQAATA